MTRVECSVSPLAPDCSDLAVPCMSSTLSEATRVTSARAASQDLTSGLNEELPSAAAACSPVPWAPADPLELEDAPLPLDDRLARDGPGVGGLEPSPPSTACARPMKDPSLAPPAVDYRPIGGDVFPHVYSRCPRRPAQFSTGGAASPRRSSPRQSCFLKKLRKKTSAILSTPPPARAPSRLPAAPPRRSRRIAGLGPDRSFLKDSTRIRRQVVRSLDIIDDNDGLDQQALDAYAQLFTHQLSESHVQALAALFGWAPPEDVCLQADLS
ncbi:hypothetical protein BS78_03G186000 [Paspalum vaginatum]|nr:hypothetical protein BS78_03G186000 [Paspalum vaginatum]